ncbi:hypothetical protein UFOVP1604_211 [uncultured Caudovirales phage]|uniref:Uncharacterized protein n=1 Tax=uncultured Caudovirales phage TaxID=2100421 RepID=A0A6J5SUB6_9CAUD|nr:hypothetical protein UFOVP1604_211 [uncultured Caudovirales phage]
MIHKYQQWIEESEKVEANEQVPTDTPEVPATTDAAALPVTTETPAATTSEIPSEPEIVSAESEIEEYQNLDKARREAIKAFKEKQGEFLEIPEDIRKNPVEEADKTKVEELKTTLIELNKTMKSAITAWNKFNSMALGIEDDEDVEP